MEDDVQQHGKFSFSQTFFIILYVINAVRTGEIDQQERLKTPLRTFFSVPILFFSGGRGLNQVLHATCNNPFPQTPIPVVFCKSFSK
ncbi:MAG: hypothetical protein B7Z48_00795 [Thiotrichales bacterium 12-47-6]|nr:MAG: hypothetical protein B7Z48_00795 [Thiotrichales bacterium 12-47-6]